MLWFLLRACRPPAPDPGLSTEEVVAYVRPGTAHAEEWARAVRAGLQAADQPVDEDHVCQVLAVIEQESGYQADPEVAGLAGIVEETLTAELTERLGFLGDDVLSMVLDVVPEGEEQSFRDRLRSVRTEGDLDALFHAMVAHHEASAPAVGNVVRALAPRLTERLNPVTTAGSMQVKVDWAQAHPVSRGMDPAAVRASMYTMEGGVRYGTLRLFATADYEEPIHRFADFNAGPYASRNAAFQQALGSLVSMELQLDGDLLAYNDRGRPRRAQRGETFGAAAAFAGAHGLTSGRVRRDLALEKQQELEATETWAVVRHAHRERGGPTPYAVVPEVQLDSPKLAGTWTTRLFAERVLRRYVQCLDRS